jgi:hypothetical protein
MAINVMSVGPAVLDQPLLKMSSFLRLLDLPRSTSASLTCRGFRRTTHGPTTKEGIALVENMVHGYMANPRSVMLAVVSCNADIATQEIVEQAEDAGNSRGKSTTDL